jgi:seryl-tRNA synthetase
MLDQKYIRENSEYIKRVCVDKKNGADIDGFIALYDEVKSLEQQEQDLNTQKNTAAKEQDATRGKEIKVQLQALAESLPEKRKALDQLTWTIPNTYSEDTPLGKDDSENVILRLRWTPPAFAFEPKDHVDLGIALDILDFDSAGIISGSRFVYLKNDLVKLQFAMIQWVMDTLTNQEVIDEIIARAGLSVKNTPFSLVLPPFFMKMSVMDQMGRLQPEEDRYCYQDDGIVLNGSAEHVLGPLEMNKTFTEHQLPIRYLGYSTAFRREAGSYGRDTKGMIRQHQFDKLEMESFCLPEDGLEEQNFMIAIQEYMMQQLEIPHHVLMCCTGDMGDCDYRHIDIEARIPTQGKYRETHSGDYMTDYQARRLNIRYKTTDGRKWYVHMNDATAFALGRTLVAIIENNQQEDGTIMIPTILQKRVGKKYIGK